MVNSAKHNLSYNQRWHFDSTSLYQGHKGSDLPYLLSFSAFIFMLIGGSLLALFLWEQSAIQRGFNHNEFYILLFPLQVCLLFVVFLILYISGLIIKMACALMLEKNRRTIELIKLMGAEDNYIIDSFQRAIFRRSMIGIFFGSVLGAFLLWGFRIYLFFLFSDINSIIPNIPDIDIWLIMLLVAGNLVYGILLTFFNRRVIKVFLD